MPSAQISIMDVAQHLLVQHLLRRQIRLSFTIPDMHLPLGQASPAHMEDDTDVMS